MKKFFINFISSVALLTVSFASANAQAYQEGDKMLNIGLGIGSNLGGSGYTNTIPPIGASLEVGITDQISVGGFAGIAGSSYKFPTFGGEYKFSYSYITFGARGSYHFATSEKLDPYAGLMLGYNVATVTVKEPANYTGPTISAASDGGVLVGGHVGARYYFNEKVAGFGEVGYGISFLTLGASFKF